MTFVLTRSMSPASFMRWKTVQVPPTRSRTASTTGDTVDGSTFCPSHVSPAIILGSSSCVLVLVNWFTALQDTVSWASPTAPVRAN